MKRAIRFLPALLITGFLAACSTLGLQPPKTFEDRIASAYTSLSAARDGSTILAQHGKLSREDFSDFINQCDSAREAIDMARVLHNSDVTAGQERLDVALALLNALNAYLEKRKADEPAPVPTSPEVSNENRRPTSRVNDADEHSGQGERLGRLATAGSRRGAWDQ